MHCISEQLRRCHPARAEASYAAATITAQGRANGKPMGPRGREKCPGTWLALQPRSRPMEVRVRPGALSRWRWRLGTRQTREGRQSTCAVSERGAQDLPQRQTG
eukprot:9483200-Pyramimonas_sp.AAC.1